MQDRSVPGEAHAGAHHTVRPDTVVLVGPMAAGKTSIGKRIAKTLDWAFVDTDAMIVAAHGPITEIFANEGEPEFRRIEAETVRTALAAPGARVVSLGGGAVLTASTREVLRDHRVVLLTTTQEAVLSRTNLDKRPLLRDDPEAWQRIFDERRPLYEEVASAQWGTERLPKDFLAQEIARWLTSHQPAQPAARTNHDQNTPAEAPAPPRAQAQAGQRRGHRRASLPQASRVSGGENVGAVDGSPDPAVSPEGGAETGQSRGSGAAAVRGSRRSARPAGPPAGSAAAP